eukprot:TRINITY_DN687_c0_g1_i3.p1 TRINITY_DN687_c0_g1~~TRINITY_DN687_c0_g1_i3.p1  ORF type:complete len:117 (-),score=35.72 TRINITY_DN687_c0_g1_i3:137-487(-)
MSCLSVLFFSCIMWRVLSFVIFFFLMIRRPPRSTQSRSSAASDVYKRQVIQCGNHHIYHYDKDNKLKERNPEKVILNIRSGLKVPYYVFTIKDYPCLLYTSPSPRDRTRSRMPSSA